MPSRLAVAVLVFLVPLSARGKPLSREEYARQTQVFEQLNKSVAAVKSDAGKFALVAGVMSAERDPNFRRQLLEMAAAIEGPAREAFFLSVMATDEDAGLRSLAATKLGQFGSEKCLASLAKAAAADRTTLMVVGDVGGRSSARRSATFALAELANRHAELADKAAEALRALPDRFDRQDNESLADARLQALYQVTRDDALLKLFFERLKDENPQVRVNGANAFQFLKLKQAPAELIAALRDESAEVRSTAALVLGRIGDPKSVEPLIAVAADVKADRGVRLNAIHSLGHMRSPPAASLMEKLLADPNVAAQAAIALYRITGKKVEQFPAGYNAD